MGEANRKRGCIRGLELILYAPGITKDALRIQNHYLIFWSCFNYRQFSPEMKGSKCTGGILLRAYRSPEGTCGIRAP